MAIEGDLTERFYSDVTRYTTSTFPRAKLGWCLTAPRRRPPYLREPGGRNSKFAGTGGNCEAMRRAA